MNNFVVKIAYTLLRLKYRLQSDHALIEPYCRIRPGSILEGRNKICQNVFFDGKLGYGSYIGRNSIVTGKVGKYVSIGSNVTFLQSTHPIDRVSTHPAFYSVARQAGFTYVETQSFDEKPKYGDTDYSIIVGNDVYIGFGATLIGPVCIGDGAVIAANATVTHDVPAYTVVSGVPAREIKKRFNDDDIAFLNNLKWWDKDCKWLHEHATEFDSIELLKAKLRGKV